MIRAAAALLIGLVCGLGTRPLPAAPLSAYERADVAPTKTSIYLGTVALKTTPFLRRDGVYRTRYAAKVFPFFFSNENGELAIDVSDEKLRELARGNPIEFTGTAVNSHGEQRHVEGKATPDDAASGRLKVRVFITKRVQLVFNTTYRFPNL